MKYWMCEGDSKDMRIERVYGIIGWVIVIAIIPDRGVLNHEIFQQQVDHVRH
jgi:hypothetical protein